MTRTCEAGSAATQTVTADKIGLLRSGNSKGYSAHWGRGSVNGAEVFEWMHELVATQSDSNPLKGFDGPIGSIPFALQMERKEREEKKSSLDLRILLLSFATQTFSMTFCRFSDFWALLNAKACCLRTDPNDGFFCEFLCRNSNRKYKYRNNLRDKEIISEKSLCSNK